MTEITTDIDPTSGTSTPLNPSGILASLIIALLAPMFLGVTAGDIGLARLAATETLNAYRTDNHAGLLADAQIVAFSLAALGSLSLSLADDISLLMALRLRSNANALNRSAEQNRRALLNRANDPSARQTSASEACAIRPDLAALPHFSAVPTPDATTVRRAMPDRGTIPTSDAETIFPDRAAQPDFGAIPKPDAETVDGAIPTPNFDTRPTPDTETIRAAVATRHSVPTRDSLLSLAAAQQLAAESLARLQPPEPLLHQPSAPVPGTSPVLDKRRQAMWAIAMVKEAQEISTGIQNLPSAERDAASIRAATLSSTANHLLYGLPAVAPKPAAQV